MTQPFFISKGYKITEGDRCAIAEAILYQLILSLRPEEGSVPSVVTKMPDQHALRFKIRNEATKALRLASVKIVRHASS